MLALGLVQKIVGAIALAVILSLSIALWAADRRADKWEAQSRKCAVARESDRNAYTAAQNEARRLNEAEVARIESEQRRITDEVQSDLNSRLERLRRELRANPAAPGGSAGGPDPGPDGSAPEGSPDSARLCLAPEVVLRGAENEERHEQLIRWVEKQLGVKR
jgi:FtsZ-interacting cell division protein ZipA